MSCRRRSCGVARPYEKRISGVTNRERWVGCTLETRKGQQDLEEEGRVEWRQRTVVVAPRGRSYTEREKLKDEGGSDHGREKERQAKVRGNE